MEIIERTDTVTRVRCGEREITLLGTAHVSRESVEEVRSFIENEKPDRVCVELDERRLKSMSEGSNWENLDIYKIIKTGQTFFFLANLAMSAFQKKIGANLDIKPGEDMRQAVEISKANNIPFTLADRDIQTTLKRAWKLSSVSEKSRMINSLAGSVFSKEDVSEEEIEQLKKRSALEDMMQEMAEYLPSAKTAIIDERDCYLASRIYACTERRIVAVLGAGHIPGILRHFEKFEAEGKIADVSAIDSVPPKSKAAKVIPWLIPVLFAAIIVTGFFHAGTEKSTDLLIHWFVVKGALASLGALVALAHPLTILAAFFAAPLTSLNPTIGVGMISGILEAVLRKPKVKDFQSLADDIMTVKGFFKNGITHILIVCLMTSIGGVVGTIIVFPWLLALLQ